MIYGYGIVAAVLLLATLLYVYNWRNERKRRQQRLAAIRQRLAEIEQQNEQSAS